MAKSCANYSGSAYANIHAEDRLSPYLSVEELLAEFPLNELSRAAAAAGLPADGPKLSRVHRLVDAGLQVRAGAPAVLGLFRAEALRRVCSRYGIHVAGKQGMVLALSGLLGAAAENLAFEQRRLIKPTLAAVTEYLSGLVLPWRLVRDEGEAESALARALKRRFRGVSTQYSIGGYFGHRIDIALGDGKVGVEVKLARAVLDSSSEAYRAIGQAVVYSHRKFASKLVVAFVGPVAMASAPALLEVCALLEATGATVAFVGLT